jgi:alkylation response protein AidB-like acyl-CoA dehydrogenase
MDCVPQALEQWLPGLDDKLGRLSLSERESPDGPAIDLFRSCRGPALLIPAEHRGLGASAIDALRVQCAVGARSPSLAVGTTMHHFSVASLVEAGRASDGLEWLLLEAVATEDLLVASGFGEGVRAQGLFRPAVRCRATEQGYVLSGTKKPCSLARSMDLITVSALLENPDGEQEFVVAVVAADAPGVHVEPFWTAQVLAGAQNEAVVLRDVAVDRNMLVRLGTPGEAASDRVQSAGFVWFELLMTASYLGMAGALVERVLHDGRTSPVERATLAGRLEATMAGLEGAAALFEKTGPGEQPLIRALSCRYAAQDTIQQVVSAALDALGGMAFIGPDPEVRYFAEASRCLAFHPPKRVRGLEGLAAAYAGAPLRIG